MMTKYLLDTNVILRVSNPSDAQHRLTTQAVVILLKQAHECYLTTQVLIELWVVATRPVEVNGLGWSSEQTRNVIEQLLVRFPLTDESSEILQTWLELVSQNQIVGKRTHDARIAAVMLRSQVTHILTLNPGDFSNIPGITVVHPQEVVEQRGS